MAKKKNAIEARAIATVVLFSDGLINYSSETGTDDYQAVGKIQRGMSVFVRRFAPTEEGKT